MPTTPQTPITTALPQAIGDLSKLVNASNSERQAVEVVVKHLSGNLLNLTRTTGLLSKPALLPNPVVSGNLTNGQTHTVQVSVDPTPSIEFYSATSKSKQQVIELTSQQLETLLKLPAKQITAQLSSIKTVALNNIMSLSATVLANTSGNNVLSNNADSNSPTNPNLDTVSLSQTGLKPLSTQQAAVPQALLTLKLTDSKPAQNIEIPLKQMSQFTAGEQVKISAVPKGANWQVTIQPIVTSTSSSLINEHKASAILNKSDNAISPSPKNTPQNQALSLLLTPSQSLNLTKPALKQALTNNLAGISELTLSVKQVIQHLKQHPNSDTRELLQKLQKNPFDKLALQLQDSNKFHLKTETYQPVASIPITKEIAQALAPLKLPEQQTLIKISKQLPSNAPPLDSEKPKVTEQQLKELNTSSLSKKISDWSDAALKALVGNREANIPTKQKSGSAHATHTAQTSATQAASNATTQDTDKNNSAVSNKNSGPELSTLGKIEPQVTLKELISQLQQKVSAQPIESSLISPKLLTSKPQQIGLIQQLLRVVQARADTTSQALHNIEKALNDPEFSKQGIEPATKQVIEQLLQQTKSTLPQGKETDANHIKQILTSPAVNLTPIQLVSASSNQGFLSGLVTMLQMTLSTRLTRAQSSRDEQVARVFNGILPLSAKTKSTVSGKGLSDFLQLEQKHQLSREIGRLFSGHQANKLHNADQLLQGQDNFYYQLPSFMNGTLQDIELLIKRDESSPEQDNQQQSTNKTWQLTMKLSIGDLGELLTKAKLRPDNLEVNFYASNQEVQIQVMNYLPLLKRRLEHLGIEVSNSQCQLGKIPDSLKERPYHVFQTKV